MTRGSRVASALRVDPANHGDKVRDKTLHITLEDDIIVENDGFQMHIDPVFLVGN